MSGSACGFGGGSRDVPSLLASAFAVTAPSVYPGARSGSGRPPGTRDRRVPRGRGHVVGRSRPAGLRGLGLCGAPRGRRLHVTTSRCPFPRGSRPAGSMAGATTYWSAATRSRWGRVLSPASTRCRVLVSDFSGGPAELVLTRPDGTVWGFTVSWSQRDDLPHDAPGAFVELSANYDCNDGVPQAGTYDARLAFTAGDGSTQVVTLGRSPWWTGCRHCRRWTRPGGNSRRVRGVAMVIAAPRIGLPT